MSQYMIEFDGRRYYADIKHSKLEKYQRVSGRDEYEVREKANAKLAEWDQQWKAKKAIIDKHEHTEARKNIAIQQSRKAQLAIDELKSLLVSSLKINHCLRWESLKQTAPFPSPHPVKKIPKAPVQPTIPSQPMRNDQKYIAKYGILEFLFKSRREQRDREAQNIFNRDYASWQNRKAMVEDRYNKEVIEYNKAIEDASNIYLHDLQQWEHDKEEYDECQYTFNQKIDELRQRYESGEKESVEDYSKYVIGHSLYLSSNPQKHECIYNSANKMLLILYWLPSPDSMPTIKEVKYVQAKDELQEMLLPELQRNSLYDDVIYQIIIKIIHEQFQADYCGNIAAIVINGHVKAIDKGTGKSVESCIVSIQAKREEFLDINLSSVDPKECFKKLKGIGSSKLHGLAPIPPIILFDKNDRRFIEGKSVAANIDGSVNLAAINWEDFEHLIRELFEQEFAQHGGECRVTQASRDGGVDAIAFDPDPIRGGKIVIQAKRYTATVGVSAVRDLYGTVVNEGATKGILVTTSDYGPDAYEFAKGKPLTLLNGHNLLHLLEKHGHQARIDIVEARQLNQSQ